MDGHTSHVCLLRIDPNVRQTHMKSGSQHDWPPAFIARHYSSFSRPATTISNIPRAPLPRHSARYPRGLCPSQLHVSVPLLKIFPALLLLDLSTTPACAKM